jgi:sugar-specific transcriptional regulator TrmB
MNGIILKLEQLGFSPYEAKAYYALLRKHPANGYEVSKIAKIPTAKVYETLQRLKQKGTVIEAEPGRFYPLQPATLMARLRQEYTVAMEELEAQLQGTEPLPDIELTMNVNGYDAVIERAVGIINSAERSLMLSVWPAEYALLRDAVRAAEARGVTAVKAVFGDGEADGNADDFTVNLAVCGASSQARLTKRLTVVVGDAREVLIGESGEGGEAEGVWTTTPAIVLVAKEYIRHDIWGHELIGLVGEDRFRTICDNNPLLAYLINKR